jgi:hypothetical protein
MSLLVIFAAAFSLATSDAAASKRQLWNGLVSFNMPAQATIAKASDLQWGDESYLVRPGGKNRNAAVLLYREDLDQRTSALPTKELAPELKRQLEDAGLKVSRFKIKKNEVTCTITGKTELPWSKKAVSASGVVRAVRVTPSLVVGAIAVSGTADFSKEFVRPFRQIVSTFKASKPTKRR